MTRARQEYVDPTVIGVITGYLGRLDEAFEWFERAFDEHDTDLFLLHGMTDVENQRWRVPSELVLDPRLDTLWRRMGLAQFSLSHGRWGGQDRWVAGRHARSIDQMRRFGVGEAATAARFLDQGDETWFECFDGRCVTSRDYSLPGVNGEYS